MQAGRERPLQTRENFFSSFFCLFVLWRRNMLAITFLLFHKHQKCLWDKNTRNFSFSIKSAWQEPFYFLLTRSAWCWCATRLRAATRARIKRIQRRGRESKGTVLLFLHTPLFFLVLWERRIPRESLKQAHFLQSYPVCQLWYIAPGKVPSTG